MTDFTVDDVTAAVAAGDFDGHLDDVAQALVDRARSGLVELLWRLRVGDEEWTQESVTLGELKFAEQHATVTDPATGRLRRAAATEIDPRSSAEHAVALIVAHFHKAVGEPLAAAVKTAESLTAAELGDIVTEYEVTRPPKGAPTPEASTT